MPKPARPDPTLYARIPETVLYDVELSANARVVYGLLDRCANKQHYCHPSRSWLARHLGVKDRRTVDRALAELVKRGHIEVTKQWNEAGDPTANLYHVVRRAALPSTSEGTTTDNGMRHGGAPESTTGSATNGSQNESHSEREPANDAVAAISGEVQRRIEVKRAAGIRVGAGLERAIRKDVEIEHERAERDRSSRRQLERHECDQCAGGWVYATENGVVPCAACQRNAA